jgi:hypothetical protein
MPHVSFEEIRELNEPKQLQGFNASAQQPKQGSIRSKLHRNNSYKKPRNPVKPTLRFMEWGPR